MEDCIFAGDKSRMLRVGGGEEEAAELVLHDVECFMSHQQLSGQRGTLSKRLD